MIVVGSGIAGCSVAMYSGRFGMKTLMIGTLPGGIITTTHLVENYPGIKSIGGVEMGMVFMDQISEHQRDLTNSASARTYGEVIAYVVSMAKRLTRTMQKLAVDHANLERNLAMQMGMVVAEPLYIILASLGHPDAHEKVRSLTLQAQREKKMLEEIVAQDAELASYLERMKPNQRQILSNPSLYTGVAARKAKAIAEEWKSNLRDLGFES